MQKMDLKDGIFIDVISDILEKEIVALLKSQVKLFSIT